MDILAKNLSAESSTSSNLPCLLPVFSVSSHCFCRWLICSSTMGKSTWLGFCVLWLLLAYLFWYHKVSLGQGHSNAWVTFSVDKQNPFLHHYPMFFKWHLCIWQWKEEMVGVVAESPLYIPGLNFVSVINPFGGFRQTTLCLCLLSVTWTNIGEMTCFFRQNLSRWQQEEVPFICQMGNGSKMLHNYFCS